MALQTSGAISLNDIHVEAGGTTSTTASLNDSDIRGLIDKGASVTMSFMRTKNCFQCSPMRTADLLEAMT